MSKWPDVTFHEKTGNEQPNGTSEPPRYAPLKHVHRTDCEAYCRGELSCDCGAINQPHTLIKSDSALTQDAREQAEQIVGEFFRPGSPASRQGLVDRIAAALSTSEQRVWDKAIAIAGRIRPHTRAPLGFGGPKTPEQFKAESITALEAARDEGKGGDASGTRNDL